MTNTDAVVETKQETFDPKKVVPFEINDKQRKAEFDTQVSMARGIVSHALNLREPELIEMSNSLEKEGLDPNHIGKFFIEMAKRTEAPRSEKK